MLVFLRVAIREAKDTGVAAVVPVNSGAFVVDGPGQRGAGDPGAESGAERGGNERFLDLHNRPPFEGLLVSQILIPNTAGTALVDADDLPI